MMQYNITIKNSITNSVDIINIPADEISFSCDYMGDAGLTKVFTLTQYTNDLMAESPLYDLATYLENFDAKKLEFTVLLENLETGNIYNIIEIDNIKRVNSRAQQNRTGDKEDEYLFIRLFEIG